MHHSELGKSLELFGSQESLNTDVEKIGIIFLQQACFAGKANEDDVSIRVRLYDNEKKNRTTQTLPCDPVSAAQHF